MRRIGGSDIAKLVGLSKHGTARDVYDRIVHGTEDEWNERMDRGAAFEPVLRAYAQNALGLEVADRDSDYHEHPEHIFAHAQIDDIGTWQGQPVVVDYKTVNRHVKGWGAPDSDDVPEHYRIQMAWELACCDRELGLLVVGFGEDRPVPEIFSLTHVLTYQLQRDRTLEAFCIQTAKEFWTEHVIPRRPPPVQSIGKKAKKAAS